MSLTYCVRQFFSFFSSQLVCHQIIKKRVFIFSSNTDVYFYFLATQTFLQHLLHLSSSSKHKQETSPMLGIPAVLFIFSYFSSFFSFNFTYLLTLSYTLLASMSSHPSTPACFRRSLESAFCPWVLGNTFFLPTALYTSVRSPLIYRHHHSRSRSKEN